MVWDKEGVKEWRKAYYQANKERIDASGRPSRIRWKQANREKIRAQRRAYYKIHFEKINAYNSAWRKAHREKVAAHMKIYHKANPEKRRTARRKRYALKHTTQIKSINEDRIFMRDGWICQLCHKKVDKRLKHPHSMCASLDHIIPLSKGGSHIPTNVQLAHKRCNSIKYAGIFPGGEQLRMLEMFEGVAN